MIGRRQSAFEDTRSRQELIFNLSLLVCTLIGVLAVSGSAIWKHAAAGDVLFADILRDLGIALLISVFVTFSIEKYSSSRLREHIAYDVLSAAYAKVVPEKIFSQITDHVFRSDIYRRNWEVHIRANSQRIDRTRGTAVITARYSYDIENLKENSIIYAVAAGIDLDDPPPHENLPRFKSFSIMDQQDHPFIIKSENELSRRRVGDLERPYELGNNVTLQSTRQNLLLTAPVRIPGRGRVGVKFEVEREIRVPGNYVLSVREPADGIKIIIDVEGFNLSVAALHPNRDALSHPAGSDSWEFRVGILPWQGFRFISEDDQQPQGRLQPAAESRDLENGDVSGGPVR
jgi:hypothetical protein